MKKFEITNSIARGFGKVGFQIKKHSPEILVAAGVIGTVTSAVMACKATTKASAIIDDLNANMDKIHEVAGYEDINYTEENLKRDTVIVYTQTAIKFAKLYGPSIILGALSLGCVIKSNEILRKRNIALAAAYATVDKGFKDYRSRVIERFGENLDYELRYNIKAKEFEETVVDEKGKEKTVKKTVNVADPNSWSEFAKVYDDGCTGWTKDPEDNLRFLKLQQCYANDKLRDNRYLFLNDVYSMLGIPKTKAGQIVGWVYNEKHPIGDNFVDFGMYNMDIEKCRDFVNGYERSIVLDFNVDGNILDLM